jgi:hypothetical protein
MPQVGSTGPHDPNNTSPGNAYNSNGGGNQTKPPPKVTQNPTITSQVFTVTCTGMKPNTVHKFYYEGQDLSSDCLPVYPKPNLATIQQGAPLLTDASGKIEFKFFYTVKIEKQVDAANKTKYELAGDKKFSLEAVNSSASKIVPYARHAKANTPKKISPPPGPTR